MESHYIEHGKRSEGRTFDASALHAPGLALVALGLDGFELVGSGVEQRLGLALSRTRDSDRLRRPGVSGM